MPTAESLKLNVGSGQRRFDVSKGWVNVDCTVREPDQVPDVVCDVGREPLPFPDGSAECVVLHHVLEHFGCGEADALVRECYRVIRPGGSIVVCVPDMASLADAYAKAKIDDFIFMVNCYGAYQGSEADRHKWGYSRVGLMDYLRKTLPGAAVGLFNWRAIDGADIARDWWIAAAEVYKPAEG